MLLAKGRAFFSECSYEPSLLEQFNLNVKERPESPAIYTDAGQISYRDLQLKINHLSRELKRHRVGHSCIVSLYIGRSVDLIVSLLSVLTVGASFLPLDKNIPRARAFKYIDIAKSEFILADEAGFYTEYDEYSINNFYLSCVSDKKVKYMEADDCSRRSTDNDLCYVIFTSGSTGKPKGVRISHENLLNALISLKKTLNIEQKEVVLFATSLAFDISLLEIFLPLYCGASMALYQGAYSDDIDILRSFIDTNKVSLVQATPSSWGILLTGDWKPQKAIKLLCGGEYLSQNLSKKLLEVSPDSWNLYGPTEATIWATMERLNNSHEKVYLGQPINNTMIMVLDHNLSPVPPGEAGEIYIGGHGVGLGYINDEPALSKRSFFKANVMGREVCVYRTGDRASYDIEGNLSFIGRIDRQIKINGQRIELNEIENCIANSPLISSVAVIETKLSQIEEEEVGASIIVAYLCLTSLENRDMMMYKEFAEKEVIKELRDNLPAVMHPSIFSYVDKIPLTIGGKIDYQTLIKDDCQTDKVSVTNGFENKYEEELAEIWRDIIGVEIISRNDIFFQCGGNSLRAAILCSRIKKAFNIVLQISDVIANPTIKMLAEKVDSRMSSNQGTEER